MASIASDGTADRAITRIHFLHMPNAPSAFTSNFICYLRKRVRQTCHFLNLLGSQRDRRIDASSAKRRQVAGQS
jgi:hypothetical protein